MPEIRLDYEPQPRQSLMHATPARQIFYGGAAGGGKSHAIRWDCISWCLACPGLQAYIFRRSYGELEDNHIRPIKNDLPSEVGSYSEARKCFEFVNGSAINFCYCEKEDDVKRYQGAEIHVLGVDEASHLTEYQLTYLRTRVRLGSFSDKIPERYKHLLPRIMFGSNPGGPGHSFLKMTFIDAAPRETIFPDKTSEIPGKPGTGIPSIYIPATMDDNRFLDENYAGQFTALSPELARALRDGDWDAVVGQAVHNLSRERHLLRPFSPPKWWTRFMAMDWGTAKPFSIGWYVVSDGATLAARDGYPEVWLPPGAVIRYDEYYGWDGHADRGCRHPSQKVAREILRREGERGDVLDYRVADPQIWAQSDGPSVQENMYEATGGRMILSQAKRDRKANYTELLSRLAGNPEYRDTGETEVPMFYVTANCTHFWRTVPTLTLDETDPEKGPGTKLEDHVYDEVCYALRSRPYVTDEETRFETEHWAEMKEALNKNVDPYATA